MKMKITRMKETTTMTNAKSVKERNTKIISTGLAIATGIGIVGVIGLRTAEDASAQNASTTGSVEATNNAVPTLDGYSAEQLQSYAQALQQEAARLSTYRDQLNKVAKQLAAKSGGAVTVSSKPAKSAKGKAMPKVAPVPPTQKKPAPQTNSQGSG